MVGDTGGDPPPLVAARAPGTGGGVMLAGNQVLPDDLAAPQHHLLFL